MLEIQNVSKTFNAGTVNEKTALNGLNLKLNEGDFVTVIGGNGAGKSTMLNAVAGVWPVDSGKIIIDGTDVTKLGEHQRAAYIGRVFQDPMTGTAATMQIEENLALAARTSPSHHRAAAPASPYCAAMAAAPSSSPVPASRTSIPRACARPRASSSAISRVAATETPAVASVTKSA